MTLAVGVEDAWAGTLSALGPMGASPSVALSITGTGFNTTASSNQVTFTSTSGPSVTVAATAVTTLSAATGLRRLTVTLPAGLPIGSAAVRVVDTATGEVSAGRSLEVIDISLPNQTSASVGANNLNVRIVGSPNTAFVAGSTRATFGAGVTVNATTVESANSLIANISVASTATVGTRAVGVITNTQTALRAGAFSVVAAPVNHPPVWTPVDNPTLNVGDALDIPLLATDADGDALTLTVSPLPAFVTFADLGNGKGTVFLRPGQAQAGTYNLIATATDARGASAAFTLTVTVASVNRPPTANGQQLTVTEDTPQQLVVSGVDPEGAAVTYSIVVPPAHGSLSGTAPALLYTPAADYFGPDTFQFVASDGVLSSDPATVAIIVTEVNDPPILGPDTATLKFAGGIPGVPPPPACGVPCGVIFGDPHLMSYDQMLFDAQAVGEVIATKSTTDDFEVQGRFAAVPNQRRVSIAVAVAMRVAGHRVTMYRTPTAKGMEVRIDGTPTTIPAAPRALPAGGTIGTYGTDDSVTVAWPDGTLAIVHAVGVFPEYYRFLVEVGIAPSRLGHVVGMLGDADHNTANDLVTRSGQAMGQNPPFATFYGTYVNSWRVSMAETLFDYGAGQSTDTFTDLTFPDAPATPQTLSAAALSRATTVCAQFSLSAGAVNDACLVDVGITGDADFATEGATAQAASLGLPNNAGSTSVDASTTVSIGTPGAIAVRTFPATSGQKVTLAVTGNTIAGGNAGVDLTVRDPNGGFVAALSVLSAAGFHEVFTLPATGTYTITVDPQNQLTGTLTFVLGAVPDNVSTTTIGTPTAVTIGTIGEVAVRTFAATAGQKVTLSVAGNTILGGGAGADLSVRDPNGGFVTALSVLSAAAFHDTFTLPTTGTYTITVDPQIQLTGTLTFTLNAVPDNLGSTTIGAPTTVTTATIGEVAVRTFTATAGQKVTLFVTSNSILDAGAGVVLTVRDPSGGFVTALSVLAATAFRDTFTLQATGTYTITVDPQNQLVGTLTFTLGAVPDNIGSTTIGTPTTVTMGTIGEVAARTFTATAGQKVTLSVIGNTMTGAGASLTVLNPSGGFVVSLSVSAGTGFHDTFTLPAAGTYTITVDPQNQLTGTLTFTLGAVPDNVGSTAVGTPTAVTIGTIGEVAVRTFAATAGQTGNLSVAGNTISVVTLTILNPTGGFVASLSVSATTGLRNAIVLPATGTYTITVDPQGQFVGGLTFTLVAN